MALTSLDIEGRRFARRPLGYAPSEVRGFLRECADALSQANLQREELARRVESAHEELEGYRQRERTLVDALAAADHLAEERKATAQAEADKIVAEAHRHAEQMIARTRAEVARVEQQIVRLKIERETFENKLSALIDEHRRVMEVRKQELGFADKLTGRTPRPPAVDPGPSGGKSPSGGDAQ
jgi:cell division initiation protein